MTIEDALREAMRVRHYCCQEGNLSLETSDPYEYDPYLKRWAEALGERVESSWPEPGKRL